MSQKLLQEISLQTFTHTLGHSQEHQSTQLICASLQDHPVCLLTAKQNLMLNTPKTLQCNLHFKTSIGGGSTCPWAVYHSVLSPFK